MSVPAARGHSRELAAAQQRCTCCDSHVHCHSCVACSQTTNELPVDHWSFTTNMATPAGLTVRFSMSSLPR